MVKFRRQHEQLRTVIGRVLRPTLNSQMSQKDAVDMINNESAPKPANELLDAADANAIEEVRIIYVGIDYINLEITWVLEKITDMNNRHLPNSHQCSTN